jgi:hypothetical protein
MVISEERILHAVNISKHLKANISKFSPKVTNPTMITLCPTRFSSQKIFIFIYFSFLVILIVNTDRYLKEHLLDL